MKYDSRNRPAATNPPHRYHPWAIPAGLLPPTILEWLTRCCQPARQFSERVPQCELEPKGYSGAGSRGGGAPAMRRAAAQSPNTGVQIATRPCSVFKTLSVNRPNPARNGSALPAPSEATAMSSKGPTAGAVGFHKPALPERGQPASPVRDRPTATGKRSGD